MFLPERLLPKRSESGQGFQLRYQLIESITIIFRSITISVVCPEVFSIISIISNNFNYLRFRNMSTSDTEDETEGEEEVQQVSVKNTVWCPIENCRNEQVRKQFLAEYRNGQRSLRQKCVTCSTKIQASNGGTTNLMNHLKFCKTRVAKQSGQPSVQAFFPGERNKTYGIRPKSKTRIRPKNSFIFRE